VKNDLQLKASFESSPPYIWGLFADVQGVDICVAWQHRQWLAGRRWVCSVPNFRWHLPWLRSFPPSPHAVVLLYHAEGYETKKKRKQKQHFYLQRVAKNDMSALSDCVCRFIHFPGNTVTVVAPTENGQSGDYKEFVSFLAPFWALFSLQFATHIFFPASPKP